MEERTLVGKLKEKFPFYGGMSLLYGILFTFCMYQNPNGITVPILVLVTIIFAVKYVKTIGLPIKKDTWIYILGMMLLGISNFMTSNWFILFFNWVGIFLLFLVMMTHQFYQDKEWQFQICFKNIFILIGTTISSISYPFKHALAYWSGDSSKKKKMITYVGMGIVIAFLLLLVIFPLLVRSDRIFEMYFGNFISKIHFGDVFWMLIMTVVITVLCYSFFSALCRYTLKTDVEQKKERYNPVVGITFTSVLAVIYLVYSGIQVVYLFIGKGLPDGITYAAYAKSGFWELLFVSMINFMMVMISMHLFEENRILKIILTVISACTFVMIGSAAYRMCMYISAYHLTFLRVLVLWFLFLLALIMGGTVFSIYKKKFPLFRYVMLVTACCYILLSLARPDVWIAKYNVAHMEVINTEDLNYYTWSLSADAAPVIAEIDTGNHAESDMMIRQYFERIRLKYEKEEIRKFNYSHWKALKAAEKYLK